MSKVVEFRGLLIKLDAVDFIGEVDFKRAGDASGVYGFDVIINGAPARIGTEKSKPLGKELKKEFKDLVLKAHE